MLATIGQKAAIITFVNSAYEIFGCRICNLLMRSLNLGRYSYGPRRLLPHPFGRKLRESAIGLTNVSNLSALRTRFASWRRSWVRRKKVTLDEKIAFTGEFLRISGKSFLSHCRFCAPFGQGRGDYSDG